MFEILEKSFRETHKITVFESIDDIMKVYTYEYDELVSYSMEERVRVKLA